jgi:FMN-dependent NADH-azoreductase
MENKILFVNSCTRPNSRTNELAQHLLNCLEGKIAHVNLYKTTLRPIDISDLEKREENIKNGNCSLSEFERAKQFADADIIVIAAPFWDLSFPSVLKIYFENITVSGVTFEYSEKGRPVSKCRAKKMYYITTSGGYIGNNNFGFDYVKALAENFFGINDISFYSAEGLDIFGADVKGIMDEAKKKISSEL